MSTVSGGPGFNPGEGRKFFSSFPSAKTSVLGVPGALYFLKLNADHYIHLRGSFKMFPESLYFWDIKNSTIITYFLPINFAYFNGKKRKCSVYTLIPNFIKISLIPLQTV